MRELLWSDPNTFDPLEEARRRFTFWVLPIGVMACVATWAFHYLSGRLNTVEQLLLWFLAIVFLSLNLALRRWHLPLRAVWSIVLLVVGAYELFNIAAQTIRGDYWPGASPALVWFPSIYLLAFTLYSSRVALTISLVSFILSLLAVGIGLMLAPEPSFRALNGSVQFGLSNGVFILLLYIYSHLRIHYQKAHQMALSDPLTGLPNRRHIEPLLEQEISRAERYHEGFAVLIADLDHFKQINDQHSHAIGDQVLQEVALRLASCLRRSDTLARWGGEEFLILAPSTNPEQAGLLASRMNEVVREYPFVGHIPLTLSLGVSCYQPRDTVEKIIIRADTALYRAKHLGRNRSEIEA